MMRHRRQIHGFEAQKIQAKVAEPAAPREYATALRHRIQRLQCKYGFPVNEGMQDRYERRLPAAQGELAL